MDPITLTLAKRQLAIAQAELAGEPLVYLPLKGDLRDKVTGRAATYTGTAKQHPISGVNLAASEPAWVGTIPGVGLVGGRVLDAHTTRWFPMFELSDGSWIGVDGASIVHSADRGANFTTRHTFAKSNVELFKTAQGSYIAIISDTATESDATEANGEIWRSVDECASWMKCADIVAGSTYTTGFDSLGDVCYLTEYGGRTYPNNARRLYRSVNDGATWTMVKDFDDFNPGSDMHTHFVRIDPYTAKDPVVYSDLTIYVGTGDVDGSCGLYKSTDGGDTWTTVGSGSQAWRITEARFDATNGYFGGDGYVGSGQRFGIYRLRKADGQWAKEADIQGPVYSMAWDRMGNLWAAVQQSPLTPAVPDIGGADWSSLMVRHAGRWIPVYNSEGQVTVPAGFERLQTDSAGGLIVLARQTGSIRERGSLMVDINSHCAGGVYFGASDAITVQLPKELPAEFTVLLAVKVKNPILGDSSLKHLWSAGTTDNHYRMYVSTVLAGRMRAIVGKTVGGSGIAAVTINSGPIVGVGECAIIAGRVTSTSLKVMVLNAATREFLSGSKDTNGGHVSGLRELKLGQYVVSGYGWQNVLGEFQLFYRALDDMELVERMYQLANYAR